METIKSQAHWLLRFALAAVFLFHGVTKFPMAANMAEMMKMPLMAVYGLAVMEVVAGVLILYGGLKVKFSCGATRLAGLIITAIMIGAIAMVHWPQWSFAATAAKPMGGMEFQVTLMAIGLFFLIRGSKA